MSANMAMMKATEKAVLIGTFAWFLFLWVMFPHGHVGFLLTLAACCGGLVWLLLRFGKRRGKAALPSDFHSSYRTSHIAVDLDGAKLWVRPVRGKDRVLHQGELRHWKHEWTETHNVWGQTLRRNNRIIFEVADLHAPTFEVSFGSFQDAATWHARLSAWING